MNIFTFVKKVVLELQSLPIESTNVEHYLSESFRDLKDKIDKAVYERWKFEDALNQIRQLMISIGEFRARLSLKNENSDSAGLDLFDEEVLFLLTEHINELQAHLEDNHPGLLPLDHFFPINYFQRILNSRSSSSNQVFDEVQAHRELNEGLKTVLTDFLEPYSRGTIETSTYRRVLYFISFTSGLEEVLAQNRKADTSLEETVYSYLFVKNFNSPDFYKHYVSRLEGKLEEIGVYRDQAFFLLYQLKTIRQYPYFFNDSYKFTAPDIATAICKYLKEELQYIKDSESLCSPDDKGANSSIPYYFHVSMTVVQLNLFFKLMIDSGIIITKQRSQLFHFIASHIGTLRKDNLSARSIKNKAYGPGRTSVLKVRESLLAMMRLLEKY